MTTRWTSATVRLALWLSLGTSTAVLADEMSAGFISQESISRMSTTGVRDEFITPSSLPHAASTCFDACCPVFYGEVEALYWRYNRADGSTNNLNDSKARFDVDYQFAPRVTAGIVFGSGLGLRGRYFDVDCRYVNRKDDQLFIDARHVDLELFENYHLSDQSAVEWSIGFRYNEFTEIIAPHPLLGDRLLRTDFRGAGVLGGLEINRRVRFGSFYGRARGALLVGDREINAPGIHLNSAEQAGATAGIVELAAGWEVSRQCYNGMILTAGIGWEAQRWFNHSITATANTALLAPVDVGFHGAVLNLAVGF
jgi:hypothetical protein